MNNLDTLIENALVVTENETGHFNIGIKDGKIAYIGDENLNAELKINASDLIILPGGIDPHVHVDQPSGDDVIMADNFQTATKSAAAGGNTTILPFDFAYFAANRLSYVGTYFCKSKYFPTSIAFMY